jgi:hypothetical protein
METANCRKLAVTRARELSGFRAEALGRAARASVKYLG